MTTVELEYFVVAVGFVEPSVEKDSAAAAAAAAAVGRHQHHTVHNHPYNQHPSLPMENAVGAETADSEVGIGDVEAGIGDSVAAVGYQNIQFALGIDSPAGPDAIVPW